MSRSVSFHPAAEDELNEAAAFYDLESPGLGAAFINGIQKAVVDILQVAHQKRRPFYWHGRR
ncbi:MAG: hypothetical protein AB1374_11575 [Bacillota bacterium]